MPNATFQTERETRKKRTCRISMTAITSLGTKPPRKDALSQSRMSAEITATVPPSPAKQLQPQQAPSSSKSTLTINSMLNYLILCTVALSVIELFVSSNII
jgi:hypothetical protein